MCILSFLPDSFLIWAINIILIAGVIGVVVTTLFKFFIQYVPSIIPFRTLIQIISLILLVCGVYLRGGYDTEMDWRAKVNEAEAKVAAAEAKSKEVNTVIKKVYVDKVKLVKDVQIVIKDRIVEKEKIIDAECKIVPEALSILNDAAKRPEVKK